MIWLRETRPNNSGMSIRREIERELFGVQRKENELHPQFVSLRDSPLHADARTLITDLFHRMGDPNGKFVRHFQGDGFHSRLFEIACFAYLESAGLSANRSFEQPDFLVRGNAGEAAIEAVTANPSGEQGADISVMEMELLTDIEVIEKVGSEVPRRMRAILNRKLRHAYHELPQCIGKPLVFMVAPFFDAGSVFYTDDTLMYCLYGKPEDDRKEDDPPALFTQPVARSISAVLYCNGFTVSKFLRMATHFDQMPELNVIRRGTYYKVNDVSDFSAAPFYFRVGFPSAPKEIWAEGVTIFENPYADVPLPLGLLPCTSRVSIRDGYVFREVFGFHPTVSSMIITGLSDSL